MTKFAYILFIFLSISPILSHAQKNRTLDSLCRLCSLAFSEIDKINALNNLANYYYNNKSYKEGDSVLKEQLQIAELSDDKTLILKTYFDNSAANILAWSPTEDFIRTIKFIQKGIDFAKKISRYDYIVIGYTRLAAVLRKRGKHNESVDAAVFALNNMQEVPDSLKAVAYIELGNCYRAKGESVSATTNYNSAFDIAIKIKNHYLESEIYRSLAELNSRNLNDGDEAKFLLLKSVSLNKKHKMGEGLIKDYLELARLEAEDYYLSQALLLADSLHFESYKFRAKEILLVIYMYKHNSEKALKYLNDEPELKEFYMKGGIENYYFELGQLYLYGKNPQPDSALRYFRMADSGMLKNYDIVLYPEIANCYEIKKDWANAIDNYLKALSYFRQTGDFGYIVSISESLSALYKETGDYKKAFDFKESTTRLKDSLSQSTKTKEVALLGIERERRRSNEELRQQEAALTKRHNLQYMSITIAICLVFVGILVMGMFPVSWFTIRLVGYFFFISLFEFIVLLLDNNILHSITHGEPLMLWLIKIGLIGVLFQIHHFLEHRITEFLESKKLLKARRKFSFKNLWPKKTVRRSPVKRKSDADETDNKSIAS